jgi:hypothetical protein
MKTRRTVDMPETLINQTQKFSEDHSQFGDFNFELRLKIKK